ncbi:hypothetical protein GYMLUDRAFT_43760 [Collybiopsis luxurians FD-317 M1]|uniref:Unplaced genomic scaffold GYMLUscaffold_27, whole genome shotgun sequence n=1 Tax=Collybiopsis luxurians FD-317 M1 TaxID=944289 RepID=A0A0D0CD66_9AGAR|nr:hypothetical protein GYMLUDRAFT_43760 [Collybiopsis luxurians FD-317 M1]
MRLKLLNDILTEISLDDQELARSLTQLRVTSDSSSLVDKLISESVEARLLQEIESRLSFISEYLSQHDSDANVLERIHQELENILDLESQVSSIWSTPKDHITRINELHTRLQAELMDAMSTVPPILNEKRKADGALTAASIEASLVKLSLFRAQAHHKLYGFASDTQPDATMAHALSIAYDKLKDEADHLKEEEQALDDQIEAYARLIRLADGGNSGRFAQIVEDYVQVEKETEECKRDLRRLGWIGD